LLLLRLKTKRVELAEDLSGLNEKYEALLSERKALEQAVEGFESKKSSRETARAELSAFQDYARLLDEKVEAIELAAESEEAFNSFAALHSKLEEAHSVGLAVLMAQELKDGQECLVCGSTSHPKKAEHALGQKVVTEQELQASRKALDKMRGDFFEARAKAQTLIEQVKPGEVRFKGVSLQDLTKNLNTLTQEFSRLEEHVARIEEVDRELKVGSDLLESIEALKLKNAGLEERLSSATSEVRQREEVVSRNLNGFDSVNDRVIELEAKRREISSLTDVLQRIEASIKAANKAKARFESKLKTAGFEGSQAFLEARMDVEELEDLASSVSDHEVKVTRVSTLLSQERFKNLPKEVLTVLDAEAR